MKGTIFIRKMIDKKEITLEYDRVIARISHNDEYGWIYGYVRSKDETSLSAEIFLQQSYGFIEAAFGPGAWGD